MSQVPPAAVEFAAKVAANIRSSSAPLAAVMSAGPSQSTSALRTPTRSASSLSSVGSRSIDSNDDDRVANSPLDQVVDALPRTRTKRGAAKSAMSKMQVENDHDEDPTMPVDEAASKTRKTKRAVEQDDYMAEAEEHEDDHEIVKEEGDEEEELTKSGKKKRKRKAKSPVTYVIPDVERLETTFKGRLGYACLNTILRKQKPPVFCSRTCRIDTILKPENGLDYVKELGRQNMIDLKALIEWNAKHNIFFMRMSSEMFPFASHPEYGYSLEYAAKELKAAGDLAKSLNMRLTTHPGQYTQLGSPRPQVIENAFRDLTYHAQMIDLMGLDKDSVMILHGGGVYGNKPETIERIKKNYQNLPQTVKNRLVFENDEICYNVDDLLPLCEDLNVPLVFDYHHDWINPSSEPIEKLWPRIEATWKRKGIKPKQHLSEPRPGAETVMVRHEASYDLTRCSYSPDQEKRAHADRCKRLPAALPDDMDLMIEAKDKEQAVFELYRIYDLAPVIHESLRPPAEVESLRTNGRKSSKRKKKPEEEGVKLEEDGEAGEQPEQTQAEETPTKPKPRAKGWQKRKGDAAVEPEPAEQEGVLEAIDNAAVTTPLANEDAELEQKPQKRRRRTKKEMEEARANGTEPPKKVRSVKKETSVETRIEISNTES